MMRLRRGGLCDREVTLSKTSVDRGGTQHGQLGTGCRVRPVPGVRRRGELPDTRTSTILTGLGVI
jgi:hypothetical protein